MATTSMTHGTSSKYTTTLTVNQGTQNILANSTVVSYSLVTTFAGGSGAYANQDNVGANFSVTINGKVVNSGKKAYNFNSSRTKTWATGSLTIPHNADGTKTLAFSFSLTGNNAYLGNASKSGSMALSTIARATTPTITPKTAVLGNTITINTPRASTSFMHEISVSYGNEKDLFLAYGVTTSYAWKPSQTVIDSLIEALPNADSGIATFKVVTYSGERTNVIGTKSATVTLSIPANVVPTVKHTVTLINGLSGAYIKGHSSAKVSATATGAKGSTIKGYTTTVKSGNNSLQSSTLQNFNTIVLSVTGDVEIFTVATDSRGRQSGIKTTINVKDYKKPKFDLAKVYRSNSVGTVQDDGAHATIEATVNVNPITGNKGTLSIDSRLKTLDNSNSFKTEKTVTGLSGISKQKITIPASTEKEYDIRLILKDAFNNTTYLAYISTANVTADFYKTGNGIAIGKVASQDYMFDISDKWSVLGGKTHVLVDENLNNIITQGIYLQPLTVKATTSNNYPFADAGFLEVFAKEDKQYVMQRYTHYRGQEIYVRTKYMATWNTWEVIKGKKSLGASILATNEGGVTIVSAFQTSDYITVNFKFTPKAGWAYIGTLKPSPVSNTTLSFRPVSSNDATKIVNGLIMGAGSGDGKISIWSSANFTGEVNVTVTYNI